MVPYINGSVKDCSISSALAMEILQSCTKLSIYTGPRLHCCVCNDDHKVRHNLYNKKWLILNSGIVFITFKGSLSSFSKGKCRFRKIWPLAQIPGIFRIISYLVVTDLNFMISLLVLWAIILLKSNSWYFPLWLKLTGLCFIVFEAFFLISFIINVIFCFSSFSFVWTF